MGVFYGLCAECVELRYMEGKEKMSLRVWLPLTKDLRNQGLDNVTVTNYGATLDNNGKLGKCYYFDGTDDRITVSGLSLPNVWSYSCWIYSATSSRNWEAVIMLNSTGGDSDLQLGFYTNPNGKVIQNSANGQYNASISWTYGVWHHFCGTFNGSDLKTYIDGILVNTKTITASLLSRTNLTIGARSINTANTTANTFFQGRLNDVRIYDHYLSPMEVKELSKGLILHYPLNRGGFGNENLLSRYVVPGQAAPTSTAAGGRTTWLGDYKITIPATENADTYFRLFTTKQLTTNATYTISCNVEGLLSGSYYRFPLYAQGNTAMGVLNLDHNGLCSLTFTMTYGTQTAATGANGETVYICFMDDSTRAIASGQGAITISNFKLEEGSIATPWCPNSSDAFATTMGLNGATEYDCSGFCNNGTRIGIFSWTSNTPKYNVSTHIGSTSSKIHISNFPTAGFGNAYSFAWWGKRSSNSPMFWGFSDGIRLNGMYTGTLWNTGDGSNNPLYKIGTTTQVTAPSVNVWHHYVMTGNGTKCYVYLDGELWAEAKTYKSISGTSIYINGWNSATDYCSDNTDISDFRIYATALSADDVKSLYQNSAYIDSNGNVYGAVHSEV